MKSLIVFVLIVSFSLFGSVTFEKTFGKEWNDHANSIIQTSDGGYIYTGCEIDSFDYIYSFFTFNKLNQFGESEWKISVSDQNDAGENTNEGHAIIQTNDGGYAIAGNLLVYGTMGMYNTEVFIVKTDKQGNVIWDNTIINGGHGFRFGYNIIETEDGGFLIIGESMLILTEYGETILYKLDSEGKFEWGRSYSSFGGGELVAHGRSVLQTKSNEFTFLGISWDDKSNILPTLVRTDSIGNELWRKTYSGLDSIGVGYSLKQDSDKDYLIFGKTDQEIYGDLAWLIKTDENGDILWEKYYGNPDNVDENTIGRSIDITSDGYILAGYTENISTGLADAWLIKTDSEGNEIWKKTFGREGDDRIYSVQQTSEGGYILAGYTDSIGTGGKDMWIIKTDETGTEIESPFLPQITELYQNYPNPFNPATEISFDLQKEGYINLTIYNSKGELVRTLFEGLKGQGMHTINFDASGLDSGLYFYKLTSEDDTITRKMLFLK